MLDHIFLGVTDLELSRRFYDAALRPLGIVRILDFSGRGSDYGSMAAPLGVEFTITAEQEVPPAPGTHVCFRAPDREAVRGRTPDRGRVPPAAKPASGVRASPTSAAPDLLAERRRRRIPPANAPRVRSPRAIKSKTSLHCD